MHCEQVETLLPLLALDALAARQKAEAEAHVAECAACRAKLADLRAALDLLKESVGRLPEAKLSDERRAAIRAIVAQSVQSAEPPLPRTDSARRTLLQRLRGAPPSAAQPAAKKRWRLIVRVAAVLVIAVITTMLVLPSMGTAREEARRVRGYTASPPQYVLDRMARDDMKQVVKADTSYQEPDGRFVPVQGRVDAKQEGVGFKVVDGSWERRKEAGDLGQLKLPEGRTSALLYPRYIENERVFRAPGTQDAPAVASRAESRERGGEEKRSVLYSDGSVGHGGDRISGEISAGRDLKAAHKDGLVTADKGDKSKREHPAVTVLTDHLAAPASSFVPGAPESKSQKGLSVGGLVTGERNLPTASAIHAPRAEQVPKELFLDQPARAEKASESLRRRVPAGAAMLRVPEDTNGKLNFAEKPSVPAAPVDSVHARAARELMSGETEKAERVETSARTDVDRVTSSGAIAVAQVPTPAEPKPAPGQPVEARPVPTLPPDATPPPVVPPSRTEEAQKPLFRAGPVNPWEMTAKDALSTFALDVDTASYAIARNYIARGSLPPAASVRMEEFVNAFDYNYPKQTAAVFGVHSEAAPSPFRPSLTLLKIGVQGRVVGREARKPAHLVLIVDASGSMERPDRMPLVKFALRKLVEQLRAEDRVSLVAFDTRASLALEAVPAGEKERILSAVEGLRCGGSTNLAEGLRLGFELAARAFRSGGTNRVILCSDGVANVGADEADALLASVEAFRRQGVTFTSVGFGFGAYDDAMLERLANRGDGSYVFVDTEAEAERVFVEQMTAMIETVAQDAKVQVAFDPARVRRYRLIGFENRAIADSDFRNDAVDAGEVGGAQSSTALYELELLPSDARGDRLSDLGVVFVRYRNADTGRIEEIAHRLPSDMVRARTPQDSPRFFLAAGVAEFAELLRGSEHVKNSSFQSVRSVLDAVAVELPLDARVQEVAEMVRRAEGLPRAE